MPPSLEIKSSQSKLSARLTGIVLLIPSTAVLGLAMYLEPDERGFGTHQQLGLGACTFMELTTLPCPMCGMTTTFTHMAHFQIVEAIQTQPFGVVLFLMTLTCFFISLGEIFYPQKILSNFLGWFSRREGFWYGLLLIGMLIGWIFKIIQVLN